VEHRLFAQISSTWRARPLTDLDVVVSSIAATTTRTGLSVTCVLDESDYPTGVTSDWDQVDALPITFDEFRGTWNYTIAPTPADPDATRTRAKRPGQPGRHQRKPTTLLGDGAERDAWITRLSAPDVTGIPAATWTTLTAQLEPAYQQLRAQEAAAARKGRPSAYPDRHEHGLKAPITQLMLATVLHERHHLPTAQISRLIDVNHVSVGKHIAKLAPLFAEHGHPIAPTDNKIKKLEHLHETVALPQDRPATHGVTT
jgi:hypothetical protein